MKKLLWDGSAQWAPGLGILIQPGEHDYADEHVPTLLAIGLTPAEPLAPAAKRKASKGEEE